MKRNELFPSKYLKAADLKEKPVDVTIDRAPIETLKTLDGKEQIKAVLYFRNAKKALPLNLTNFDSVSHIVGDDDTDRWAGHRVQLYPSTTQMAGKVVDCIRIRVPAQRELPQQNPPASKPSSNDDETDDGVPF